MNPWLTIPAEDYEGHMGDPAVGQLQFLSRVFGALLERFTPQRVAVVGCATGNGFDRIDPKRTERLVGIDVHPGYLAIARERYGRTLPQMELMCGDVLQAEFPPGTFDLIYCGLVLEYVPVAEALSRMAPWLTPRGVLAAVLQLPTRNLPTVSATRFTSLGRLASVLQMHEPAQVAVQARQAGLGAQEGQMEQLESGKTFHVGLYAENAQVLARSGPAPVENRLH